jgi:hypothetical protein
MRKTTAYALIALAVAAGGGYGCFLLIRVAVA